MSAAQHHSGSQPLVLSKFGLALGWLASTWFARPSDATSIEGWAFAAVWCAGAWLFALLLQLLPRLNLGTGAIVGVLIGLALGEAVFVATVKEPLVLLVKPLLLAAPAVVGGLLGHYSLARHRSAA